MNLFYFFMLKNEFSQKCDASITAKEAFFVQSEQKGRGER